MDVLTEDKLAQLLSSIGIHSEDIQSAISDSHAHATSKGITSLQNIASKAIANTASRIAQSKDEESVGVWPPTRLKKDWRPQEDTILMLQLLYPENDRVAIGFVREEFKKQYLGTVQRQWDSVFFKYATQRIRESLLGQAQYESEASVLEDQIQAEEEPLSLAELARREENRRVVRHISAILAYEKSASRSFRYIPTDNWRPHQKTIEALQKKGANKNFLLDPMILNPFRTFASHNITNDFTRKARLL